MRDSAGPSASFAEPARESGGAHAFVSNLTQDLSVVVAAERLQAREPGCIPAFQVRESRQNGGHR